MRGGTWKKVKILHSVEKKIPWQREGRSLSLLPPLHGSHYTVRSSKLSCSSQSFLPCNPSRAFRVLSGGVWLRAGGQHREEGVLPDPLLLCRPLQPQRVRGAEADRHQQEILHQLQAVVPEEDLREVNVSTRPLARVSPKTPLRRWVLGGRSRWCDRRGMSEPAAWA